jgi:hypothetical protein
MGHQGNQQKRWNAKTKSADRGCGSCHVTPKNDSRSSLHTLLKGSPASLRLIASGQRIGKYASSLS